MAAVRTHSLICLIAILLLPGVVFSQVGDGEVDANGKKQGFWVVYGKHKKEKGYPDECKIEEGNYQDDRKTGVWVKYHRDPCDQPRLEGNYVDGKPQGKYRYYGPNGKVAQEGERDGKKSVGAFKTYFPSGEIQQDLFYNAEGKQEGTQTTYFINGQIEMQVEFSGGKKKKATYYYENGDIKREVAWDEEGNVTSKVETERVNPEVQLLETESAKNAPNPGKAHRKDGKAFEANGYNILYNDNDELYQDGEFKNGRLWDGKVYKYDADGILLKIEIYKEGKYNSDGQI